MRKTPLTIGILAAELAAGALAAPPAVAEELEPVIVEQAPDTPAPEPDAVEVVVRTGRAADAPTPPAVVPELPVALPATPSPPVPAPPPAPAPDPAPAPVGTDDPAPPAPPVQPSLSPAGPTPAPAAAAPPSHTVAAGDNLWEIAARQVAQTSGRDRAALAPLDVVGYWVRVCEANRGRLRSGDLDLIFEGEVVELPPV